MAHHSCWRVAISPWAALAAFVLTLLLVVSVGLAQDVPRLDGPVTDLAETGDGFTDARRAIGAVEDTENVQLFVLLVDTTGSRDVPAYTDDVAVRNNLGGRDALLVIAIDDRTYQLWLGDLLLDEVTEDEQDRILADRLEPALRDGDFDAAIADLAKGLGEAHAGALGEPAAEPVPGASAGSGGGGGIHVGWVFLALLVLVGGVGGFLFVASRRSRRGGAPGTKPATGAAPTPELVAKANAILLESDEALRDARQEAAFAEAQYGTAEAAEITRGLDEAAVELKAAFAAYQQVDDSVPDTPQERRQLLETVVARCVAAGALITAQEQRIAQLRDLERRAPEALAELPALIQGQERRLQPLDVLVDGLDRLADSVFDPIDGNLEEAAKRLAFAAAAVESGQSALGAGNSAPAAAAACQAQEAVEDAKALLDAIERQHAAARQAAIGYEAKRAEAARDLASAQDAVGRGQVTGFDAQLAEADAALRSAMALATAPQPDAIAALAEAVRADSLADAVLAGVRDHEQRSAKAKAQLVANLEVAEGAIRRAEDYLATRRTGVGREARTRLADATRALEEARALERSDPEQASGLAVKAQKRADEAYDLARGDFARWDRDQERPSGSGSPGAFPRWPSGRSGGGDAAQAGAIILGQVLGGILGGGGKRGGGFGGSGWGAAAKIGGRMAGGGFGKGRSRGGRW
ncbi:MAG: TPM domain-containing protein [Dehalococcoidia bacterium]